MASLTDKELWIGFARDAMASYSPIDAPDNEELVDDMLEVSSDYADAMLDEVNERFGGAKTGGRRRRKTKRKTDEDDEDD